MKETNHLKRIAIGFTIIIFALFLVKIYMPTNSETTSGNNFKYFIKQNNGTKLISDSYVSFFKKQKITEPTIGENSPVLGNPDAPVTIFEFSSFGCSYSREVQEILKSVLEKYPDQVRLVWKDLPLAKTYSGASLAHRAARCAQTQNQFWQYHNLLWQNQDNFTVENLGRIAQDLGLDSSAFDSCLNDPSIDDVITADEEEADGLLIPGTPHFYINSQELVGTVTLADFEQIIEIELNR